MQFDGIIKIKSKIIVKCNKQDDAAIAQLLDNLDKEEANVTIEKKLNLRLKVTNIDYDFGSLDNEVILQDIMIRNEMDENSNKISIINKYSNNNKRWPAIIDAETYTKIIIIIF